MSNFITKDDPWGIRQMVRDIWTEYKATSPYWGYPEADFEQIAFDSFYNQFLPEAWRDGRSSVLRHFDDFKALLKSDKSYQVGYVWYKRGGQFTCANLNFDLYRQIKEKKVEVPTYLEIEEEKQKWQSHPNYKKQEGYSEPIKEELIQLRLVSKH